MAEPPRATNALLIRTLVFVVGFYLTLKVLLPPFGGWLAADDWFSIRPNLDSSGREITLYMSLGLMAWYCYLSYNEERWQAFLQPIHAFLLWKHPVRLSVLALIPVIVGSLVLYRAAGGEAETSFNAIRHPTPPDQFSKLANPWRTPTDEMLADFDAQLRGGELDVETTSEDELAGYAKALESGTATPEQRETAFLRHTIEEGRNLYLINCRPCHGTKAMGDGPMSPALRRKPADFTGVETIATLVEGAVFWRVKQGGIKLPREGGPWESAMPRWELDLTDDEIWKIIMAEYDLAGNAPREPEKVEQAEEHGS